MENQNKELESIVEGWIASPPTVYMQLKNAVEDPSSSFREIELILQNDPALVARLLKIVNSAFYGFDSRVETVNHALSIVGLNQLVDLVLATTVLSQFNKISKDLISMEGFWQHSIACGIGAKLIAGKKREPEVDRFYVAGMLHDLGSLALYKKKPSKAAQAIELSREKNQFLFQAEQSIFGFSHPEVGGLLLKSWNLPPRLLEPVYHHHQPLMAKQFPFEAAVIHVADHLAYEMGFGSSGEQFVPPLEEAVLKKFSISTSLLASVKKEIEPLYEETVDLFLQAT